MTEATTITRDHEARLIALWGRDYIAEFAACNDWCGEYPEAWDDAADVAGYDLQRFARLVDGAADPAGILRMQRGAASDLAWTLG